MHHFLSVHLSVCLSLDNNSYLLKFVLLKESVKDCMERKSIFYTVRLNITRDLNEVVILSLFSIFWNRSQILSIGHNCHFAQLIKV